MTSKFWAELSNDYEKLFEDEIGYDVIIYAGEEPNTKEIHAHSNILCIRSQYFRAAFSNEWAEKKGVLLKNLQGPDVLKLLIAVDELNIQQLISHIQEYLIEHQTEFLYQDPTGIIETVYQHETFTSLWNFYLKKICEEPKILFNTDKFINLKPSLLELLLYRDDLNIDEIEIWENLLKWCFAQQKIINDPKNWNKEDIMNLERVLHRFIPMIRFYDIEPTDFFYRVYNYKDIIPQDLIHDLLEFHIVPNMKKRINITPPRKPKLDSTLIGSKHLSVFASWIDKRDSMHYDERSIPYKFKLLYRSNQDGFNTSSFHRNCDNKGPTVWIAKIRDSKQLIGGYNPLDWGGNCNWKNTTDSFLFNIEDGKNIFTARLGLVNSLGKYAICCNNNHGPQMGNLYCPNSNIWSYNTSGTYYSNVGIPENIIVECYEVFQVIKL
ncbi:hypothetical protein RclHR1_00210016 [Rhizophagus clarus]|uniref:BTB domain-containing protein n=1 Tax=Rhizophagus clarus TaxID=94130 RepID=A0A2Z6QSJ7_9GLOM|nr:hypothetical protein RclHR1_00210016 [Rhizophagus clarus]